MVAKKHKSKRVPAALRYKIQKNVRDHARKTRREARNNPVKKAIAKNKDPGIPSMWPMKEDLLHDIENHKMKIESEKERQKSARAALMAKNRNIGNLLINAEQRQSNFNANNGNITSADEYKTAVDAAVSGVKDNSKKAYHQEFQKVVQNSDVILEVLDARDPIGCRTKSVEEMVLRSGNKRIILVLNKIDLVPRENADAWLKHLRNEFPTVAFKASTQEQARLSQSNVNIEVASRKLLNSSECLGAEDLLNLLKNYCRNSNIKTSISVGVIGYPNTGKSSIINSLKRAKVCSVGAVPGHTKHAQEIYLDKHIKLLDCPGIVFSAGQDSAEAVLRNCIKVELLEDPIIPVEAILKRSNAQQMMKIYGVPAFRDVHDFLIHAARNMGRLKKGGVADLEGTARKVIQDWNGGKIAYYTAPPAPSKNFITSEVVTQYSKEFNLDDIEESQNLVVASVPQSSDFGIKFMKIDSNENAVDMNATVEMDEEIEEEEQVPVVITSKSQAIIDPEEALLNPRHGAALKQFLKKQKKLRRKTEKAAFDSEDYDFEDFQ